VDQAELLERARARCAAGELDEAWADCAAVAARAREQGDPALLADAATALRGLPPFHPVAGQVHRLCHEALAALGDTDPVRTARVRAHRDATRSPWDGRPVGAGPQEDPETRLLALQAEHARLVPVEHVAERLALGDEALALAEAHGTAEAEAWGRTWRILALGQLGRRVGLDAEVAALAAAVARLDQPVWRGRLDLVRAGRLLLDGRFAAAAERAARAGGFLGLVMRSQIAELTGEGLTEIEAEVRVAVDGLPFLARGWHAQLLALLGRRDEAAQLWRAIAPHTGDLPASVPEWLVATVGHADLAVLLDDHDAARELRDQLAPHAHLHVLGAADGPYGGPVSWYVGRLEALLGDRAAARDRLGAALAAAERMHALPWVAWTHLDIARLADPASSGGADHLAAARALADRLGMAPLAAAAEEVAARRAGARRGPLSPRETEIAACVAEGLGNRAIAARLHLSERTVENHVSHVLRKLALPSRAAVATWYVRSGG
jgi:DNA-binding CsgD family transcriptional regulator